MAALFAVLCLAALCWGGLGQTTTMIDGMVNPTTTAVSDNMGAQATPSVMDVMGAQTSSMSVSIPMSPSPMPTPTDIPMMANFGAVGMTETVDTVMSARTASQLNDVYNPAFGLSGTSRFDNTLSRNIRRNYYFNVSRCVYTHACRFNVQFVCVWWDEIFIFASMMYAWNEECVDSPCGVNPVILRLFYNLLLPVCREGC